MVGGINGGSGYDRVNNYYPIGGKQEAFEEPDLDNGKFGKGGEGIGRYIVVAGLATAGGGGYYGGLSGYHAGGGGSGYIDKNRLYHSNTTTFTHIGNGECKITLLTQ